MSEYAQRESSSESGTDSSSATASSAQSTDAEQSNQAAQDTLNNSRTVEGTGGYVYQQFQDGSIVIVGGTTGVGVKLSVGQPGWQAITDEIGPWVQETTPPAVAETVDPSVVENATEESSGGWMSGWLDSIGDAAMEMADDVAEEVWSWWATEEPQVEESQTEEPQVEESLGEDAGTTTGNDWDRYSFDSQRDNEFDETNVFDGKTERISGDSMCNITTLSMQLKAMSADDTQLMRAAADLYLAHGGSGDVSELVQRQLEDLLMSLFAVLGDDYFARECGYAANTNYGPHQYRNCMQHVAKLFTDVVGSSQDLDGGVDEDGSLSKDPQSFYEQEVGPYLDSGSVMISTKLTGGHIVLLVDVVGGGIVINDPYGVRVDAGYIKNGDIVSSRKSRIEGATDELDVRYTYNEAGKDRLMGSLSETTLPQDIGEFNYYTWAEVNKWAMGKWVSCLTNAS